MNKARVETISDGVFAIVMTLLIFDVKVPAIPGPLTDAALWQVIGTLTPLLLSYALSFLVLSVFWLNHHFLFHSFTKGVDRVLNLLNMLYLMFLASVPFSAHLLGTYPRNEPAVLIYGLNILAIMLITIAMQAYVLNHPDLAEDLSPRLRAQARARTRLSLASYVIGILISFVYIPASIFFYLFPMVFNVLPGTLNLAERVFGFELGA